jgi:fluoride exporter
MTVLLGVALLGGLGALARFLLDGAVSLSRFPFGTLAVNLTGAFLLGVLVGATANDDALRLAGTGFLGAYTTFSTWLFESHRLAEDGGGRLGLLNIGGSLVLGVLCAWLGRLLGGAL